jgi:hypothetical protein
VAGELSDPKPVYAELVEPKATAGQPLFFSSGVTRGRLKKKQSFDKLRIDGAGVGDSDFPITRAACV